MFFLSHFSSSAIHAPERLEALGTLRALKMQLEHKLIKSEKLEKGKRHVIILFLNQSFLFVHCSTVIQCNIPFLNAKWGFCSNLRSSRRKPG